jgi:cytoskeletal protein CcmA (bactofilin family)
MAIFNRDKSSSSSSSLSARPRPAESGLKPERRAEATYIAAGSKVSGEISGSAEVLVDGEFEGRLHLDSTVTIGREGRVKGEIRAKAVRVEGRVVGDVRGLERVEVMASGTLEGDISASRVVIAEGAFFKGNVEMTGVEAAAKAPTRRPEPAPAPTPAPTPAAVVKREPPAILRSEMPTPETAKKGGGHSLPGSPKS